MAKFFVGQRVRIRFSLNWPELAGCEGTIVDHSPGLDAQRVLIEWGVRPDDWSSPRAPRIGNFGSRVFCASSDQLEPLTRPDASTETDRNAIVEWSDCEWMPDHLRERA